MEVLSTKPFISKLNLFGNKISDHGLESIISLLKDQIGEVNRIELDGRLDLCFLGDVLISPNKASSKQLMDEIRDLSAILKYANAEAYLRQLFLMNNFQEPLSNTNLTKIWKEIFGKMHSNQFRSALDAIHFENKSTLTYLEMRDFFFKALIDKGALHQLKKWQYKQLLSLEGSKLLALSSDDEDELTEENAVNLKDINFKDPETPRKFKGQSDLNDTSMLVELSFTSDKSELSPPKASITSNSKYSPTKIVDSKLESAKKNKKRTVETHSLKLSNSIAHNLSPTPNGNAPGKKKLRYSHSATDSKTPQISNISHLSPKPKPNHSKSIPSPSKLTSEKSYNESNTRSVGVASISENYDYKKAVQKASNLLNEVKLLGENVSALNDKMIYSKTNEEISNKEDQADIDSINLEIIPIQESKTLDMDYQKPESKESKISDENNHDIFFADSAKKSNTLFEDSVQNDSKNTLSIEKSESPQDQAEKSEDNIDNSISPFKEKLRDDQVSHEPSMYIAPDTNLIDIIPVENNGTSSEGDLMDSPSNEGEDTSMLDSKRKLALLKSKFEFKNNSRKENNKSSHSEKTNDENLPKEDGSQEFKRQDFSKSNKDILNESKNIDFPQSETTKQLSQIPEKGNISQIYEIKGSHLDMKKSNSNANKPPEFASTPSFIEYPENMKEYMYIKFCDGHKTDIDFSKLLEVYEYPNIEHIMLRNNKISIVESLSLASRFQSLKSLDLAGNGISFIDRNVSFPPSLLQLDLSHNSMKDVTFLMDCINLQAANLSHNLIKNIFGLPSKLFRLDLSFNCISTTTSIRALGFSPDIESISLKGNPVIKAQPGWKVVLKSVLLKLVEIDGLMLPSAKLKKRKELNEKQKLKASSAKQSPPSSTKIPRSQQRINDISRSRSLHQKQDLFEKEKKLHQEESINPQKVKLSSKEIDLLSRRLSLPKGINPIRSSANSLNYSAFPSSIESYDQQGSKNHLAKNKSFSAAGLINSSKSIDAARRTSSVDKSRSFKANNSLNHLDNMSGFRQSFVNSNALRRYRVDTQEAKELISAVKFEIAKATTIIQSLADIYNNTYRQKMAISLESSSTLISPFSLEEIYQLHKRIQKLEFYPESGDSILRKKSILFINNLPQPSLQKQELLRLVDDMNYLNLFFNLLDTNLFHQEEIYSDLFYNELTKIATSNVGIHINQTILRDRAGHEGFTGPTDLDIQEDQDFNPLLDMSSPLPPPPPPPPASSSPRSIDEESQISNKVLTENAEFNTNHSQKVSTHTGDESISSILIDIDKNKEDYSYKVKELGEEEDNKKPSILISCLQSKEETLPSLLDDQDHQKPYQSALERMKNRITLRTLRKTLETEQESSLDERSEIDTQDPKNVDPNHVEVTEVSVLPKDSLLKRTPHETLEVQQEDFSSISALQISDDAVTSSDNQFRKEIDTFKSNEQSEKKESRLEPGDEEVVDVPDEVIIAPSNKENQEFLSKAADNTLESENELCFDDKMSSVNQHNHYKEEVPNSLETKTVDSEANLSQISHSTSNKSSSEPKGLSLFNSSLLSFQKDVKPNLNEISSENITNDPKPNNQTHSIVAINEDNNSQDASIQASVPNEPLSMFSDSAPKSKAAKQLKSTFDSIRKKFENKDSHQQRLQSESEKDHLSDSSKAKSTQNKQPKNASLISDNHLLNPVESAEIPTEEKYLSFKEKLKKFSQKEQEVKSSGTSSILKFDSSRNYHSSPTTPDKSSITPTKLNPYVSNFKSEPSTDLERGVQAKSSPSNQPKQIMESRLDNETSSHLQKPLNESPNSKPFEGLPETSSKASTIELRSDSRDLNSIDNPSHHLDKDKSENEKMELSEVRQKENSTEPESDLMNNTSDSQNQQSNRDNCGISEDPSIHKISEPNDRTYFINTTDVVLSNDPLPLQAENEFPKYSFSRNSGDIDGEVDILDESSKENPSKLDVDEIQKADQNISDVISSVEPAKNKDSGENINLESPASFNEVESTQTFKGIDKNYPLSQQDELPAKTRNVVSMDKSVNVFNLSDQNHSSVIATSPNDTNITENIVAIPSTQENDPVADPEIATEKEKIAPIVQAKDLNNSLLSDDHPTVQTKEEPSEPKKLTAKERLKAKLEQKKKEKLLKN